jgi:phage terminase small subunit
MADNINAKQKKFADEYIKTGNAELSAKIAGYNARGNTTKLLQNTTIIEYIKQRNKQLDKATIADMTEVKEFWSNTLRDNNIDLRERLKASEYIAKTNAAFIEKVEAHNLNENIEYSPEERKKKILEYQKILGYDKTV